MGCHCKLKMVDEHRKTAEMSPEEMGRLEDELKLACPKRSTQVMSAEERNQLEVQITADLKQTIYQTPADYQNPEVQGHGLFDDEPLPKLNHARMSPLERIEYWSLALIEANISLANVNQSERLFGYEPRYVISTTRERDYDRERLQIRLAKAEFYYQRGLAKDAGDAYGAQIDIADALKSFPDHPRYKSRSRDILRQSMIFCPEE